MRYSETDVIFDEWESMHDVLIELDFTIEITKQVVVEYFNKLSDHTQHIALQWGMSDTVFRDEAFVEIRHIIND